jgi:Trp operon repressor
MFEELDSLLESPTIRPTFEKVHVILALFIFAENREGIGRYRLQKELLIGEGTAKSLIKKLNKDISFITVTKETKRKGHFLTQEGINYLQRVKKIIPIIKECETSLLKEIIIEAERIFTYFCLVKNALNKITDGVSQRDAAIKVDGSGATCLVFDGEKLIFPSKKPLLSIEADMIVNDSLYRFFKSGLSLENIKLERNDVIAIGSGDSPQKARLATLNAALTLI